MTTDQLPSKADGGKARLSKREKRELRHQLRLERYRKKKLEAKRKPRARRPVLQNPPEFHIVIEMLGGAELMTEREMKSLAQQLRYCYSENKKACTPVSLYFSRYSLISDYMTEDTLHWEHVLRSDGSVLSEGNGISRGAPVVFLTADSPETLESLDPETFYVIGGLVDRNRHKGYSEGLCRAAGVQTARLPVSEHVAMQGSQSLSTNQVFSILMSFIHAKSWGTAVPHGVPGRKLRPRE